MPKMPYVEVVWDDTEDPPEGGWMTSADAKSFSESTTLVESCGYLVSKTEKYVTICGDFIENRDHHGRLTKIPMPVVKSITEIVR
jgi:hypothetical protein